MTDRSSRNPTARTPESPRILILGRNGQLGRELEPIFAGFGSVAAFGRETVDLADADQVRAVVRQAAPDVILNAAAYTAVDRAETESDLALAVNAHAPRILAQEALKLNALLVHYSTDYVFDGKKQGPWVETDIPMPLNIYGASKLAGEQALQEVGGSYLIFRTSWVYAPRGKNFLLTMLRLARERNSLSIVDDQFGAPTTAIELARATQAVVKGLLADQFGSVHESSGIYHMTCSGSTSWFGFAQAIFERASKLLAIKSPQLTAIPTRDYPTPAARPQNSVLSNTRLHARFGVQLAAWETALDEALQTLKAEG
ncbi:MAG: dTDP-4-dehydrorhamnose reductase [Terracidiphilus sp.]